MTLLQIIAASKRRFSPLSLSPALWLSDTGSNAGQWDDLSENNRHATQSDASKKPAIVANALNGRQVRRFDGGNAMSLAADLALGTDHTIFVVAQNAATITAATAAQVILNGGSYTYASTTTSEFLFGAGSLSVNYTNERLYSSVIAHSTGGAQHRGYAKINADVSGAFLVSHRFTTSGDAFSGTFNGASDYASAGALGGFSALNTRYPTLLRHIGFRGSAGTMFWLGDIAEIIVFPTALSDADRSIVTNFLHLKYAIF